MGGVDDSAVTRSQVSLRRLGATRFVDSVEQVAVRFHAAHEAELNAIRSQHFSGRMKAGNLLVFLVLLSTATMIGVEFARYAAGGRFSGIGVTAAVISAGLAVAAVIVLGSRPLPESARSVVVFAAGAMAFTAFVATRGVSADWARPWYLGTGVVVALCSIRIMAVRGRHSERLATIDQDLIEVSNGRRRDLEAELTRIAAGFDDGAPFDARAERLRAQLIAGTVEQVAPKIPGSDWKHPAQVRAEQAEERRRHGASPDAPTER